MAWAPSVEVAFGSSANVAVNTLSDYLSWTDLTQFAAGTREDISISRGRQDEQSTVQPAQLSLLLNNQDGRFSPDNASGAYSPNVELNKPIRVRLVRWTKNLATNTSYEVDISGTSAGGSVPPTLSQSSAFAQDGTKSLLITWGTGGTLPLANISLFYGLDVGRQYTASAYLRVPTGDPDVLLTAAGAFSSVMSTKDAFVRVSVTFTATSTSHTVQVWPNSSPTAGDLCYVDAVQPEAGGSATMFDATAAVIYPRFFGYVNRWPIALEGRHAVSKVAATDRFRLLERDGTLRSFLTQEAFDQPTLQAYYELGEVSADTQTAGDVAAKGAGTLAVRQVGSGGTIDDTGTGPATDGLSAAKFTAVDANNGKALTGNIGSLLDSNSGFTVELWLNTTQTDRHFFALEGVNQDVFYIKTTSTWVSVGHIRDGLVINQVGFSGAPNMTNGTTRLVTVEVRSSGSTVQLWVDGTSVATDTSFGFAATGFDTITVGGHVNTGLAFGSSMITASMAAVAVYKGLVGSSSATRYTAGTTGFAPEASQLRIQRLARYAGVVSGDTTVDTGLSSVASQAEGGKRSTELMSEVEKTESGLVIMERDGKLGFHGRARRYNPSSAFTIGVESSEDVGHSYDDQLLLNKAVYGRAGGATVTRKNQTSIDKHTEFVDGGGLVTLLTTTDNELVDRADWTVNRFGTVKARIPSLEFEASTLAVHAAVLTADVDTMFTLNQIPAGQIGVTSVPLVIEGYTESIGLGQHRFKVNCSPAFTDSVFILDDATFGKLDLNKLGF